MAPIISVIIPVYNVELYLEQCLNSVLVDNNVDKIEVVCVNDGSTDNSLSLCEMFAKRYNNVKVISQPNAGLSAARNTGLLHASGQYVCFLDSDDYLLPNALKIIKEQIKNNSDVDVMCCNTLANGVELAFPEDFSFINGNGRQFCEYFYSKKNFAYPTEAWHYICMRQFLIKNQIQFKHGFLHEDEDFTPRILLAAQSVCILSTPILFYRVKRDGAISATIKEKNYHDILQIVRDLYTYFNKNSAPDLFYKMQYDLFLSTLYQMDKRGMKFSVDDIELLRSLSKSLQQIRTTKLATINIKIAYAYYNYDMPRLLRRGINIACRLIHE